MESLGAQAATRRRGPCPPATPSARPAAHLLTRTDRLYYLRPSRPTGA
jgi:hypothetical protein